MMEPSTLLLLLGMWQIVFSLIMTAADNWMSRLYFKIIPFFSGVFISGYALIDIGWFVVHIGG